MAQKRRSLASTKISAVLNITGIYCYAYLFG